MLCGRHSGAYPRGDERLGQQLHVRHVLHDGRLSLLERLHRLVGHRRLQGAATAFTVISEHICFSIFFSFSVLHFLVVGSER